MKRQFAFLMLALGLAAGYIAAQQIRREITKIKNAVILAGIGSVRNYHFHTVSNRDFPIYL